MARVVCVLARTLRISCLGLTRQPWGARDATLRWRTARRHLPAAARSWRSLTTSSISSRELLVLDQTLSDGQRFRWLCSRTADNQDLVAESLRAAASITWRRSNTIRFNRELLLPEYHRVMAKAFHLVVVSALNFEGSLLFLGVGGGTLPLHLAWRYPPRAGYKFDMTGVEACGLVHELALAHFGWKDGPRLKLLGRMSAEHCLDMMDAINPRSPHFPAVFLDCSSADGAHEAPPPAMCNAAFFRRLLALRSTHLLQLPDCERARLG